MEETLNHLKFMNTLSTRGVHIPNCDKKGFYKKKQVRVPLPLPVPATARLWVPSRAGLPDSDTLQRDKHVGDVGVLSCVRGLSSCLIPSWCLQN